jgi:dihydrofolate reductase
MASSACGPPKPVADLVYSALASLDGFVADAHGNFDWAMPSEEVHAFVNDLERPVCTYLYGRRMYDVMMAWESDDLIAGGSDAMRDYAKIWRAAEKVVYSRTLAQPSSARTRVEREFDAEAVRLRKVEATAPLSIGGPELASHALAASLVDEIHLILAPVIVGDGKAALPPNVRLGLRLIDQRRFDNGAVYLRYRVAT